MECLLLNAELPDKSEIQRQPTCPALCGHEYVLRRGELRELDFEARRLLEHRLE